MSEKIYDVIIIGGGPAGFTSAIYTARERLDSVLLEKLMTGGTPNITHLIENYPGFPEGISGMELMQKFRRQAERFDVDIKEFNEVTEIIPGQEYHTIKTEEKDYHSRTVIIATGGFPRLLKIPGEKELTGRGVSYCATCDGPFFKDKDIVVVGGGNSGIQEGLYLTHFVRSIKLVEYMDHLNAEKILQNKAQENSKFTFFLNHKVLSINGEQNVTSVSVEDRKTGKSKELKADGIFIFIGWVPNTAFVKNLLKLDSENYIITDQYMNTNIKGIFAIGDVRSRRFRQIAEAVGDATVGALAVSEYISEME